MVPAQLGFSLIIAVAALAVIMFSSRRRWAKARAAIGPEATLKPPPAFHAIAVRTGLAANLIARSEELLKSNPDMLSTSGLAALGLLQTQPAAVKAIDDLIVEALAAAELRSALFAGDGNYVYAVAIPRRHEHAHLLRRHAVFAGGWRKHAERLRDSLGGPASPPFQNLLAILIFLSPTGGECRLQLSSIGPNSFLLPAPLVEEQDANLPNVAIRDLSIEFRLAA